MRNIVIVTIRDTEHTCRCLTVRQTSFLTYPGEYLALVHPEVEGLSLAVRWGEMYC